MDIANKGVGQLFKEAFSIAISRQRQREVLRMPLYANSIYLMMNSAVAALLGFVFWVVVTRLYPTEAVGLGSALISAAGLLVFVASLGLGTGLIRFLPGAGALAPALVNACFTLAGLVALIVAAIFVAGIPVWSPALIFLRENPIFIGAFVAFVAAGTVLALLSEVFVALRRAEFTIIPGSLMGLLKIVLVVAGASLFKVFGIFGAWGVAVAIALGLSIFLFLPRLQPGYRPVPTLRKQVSNEMVHFSFVNYMSNGLLSAPTWLLPIIVVNRLGPEANAYFFMSWGMAGLLFAIPMATAYSLFAEGSHQERSLAQDVRRSFKLIMVLLIPAIALMLVAGDKLLLVFGREYSQQGAKLLWVLAISALPVSVNLLYLGIARVKKKFKDVILVAATVALGTIILSYLLIPPLGILGPGVGWLVSQTLVALAVLPRFSKVIKRGVVSAVEPPYIREGDKNL